MVMTTATASRSASLVVISLLVLHARAQPGAHSVAELLAEQKEEAKNTALRGSASLDSQWTPLTSAEGQQFVTPQVEESLLLEVEKALGKNLLDSSRERVSDILKALEPTFESLDKNEYGKLGHTAVRYALHRLFVTRHGWLMKGLDPAGQHFNSSSPVQVLEGKTDLHVQGIFEKRLSGQGFGLQELAAFAAVLETLISTEVTDRLEALYKKLNINLDTPIEEGRAVKVLELYMTAYILSLEIEETSKRHLTANHKQMNEIYHFWDETQKLIRDVRSEVLGTRERYSFKDLESVLVKVGERFGKFQNAECQELKARLVSLESDEQGCVPLSSFYKRMFTTGGAEFHFGENIDYLKQNGILDESDPENVRVLVANYMNSQANCIASSQYYGVCCIDECESLLGRIESYMRAPTASPSELAALVAAMPSATVPANRTLPPSQIHRLQKIAEKHGGRVPIHGRLFMQWMHMVYPRECAYPHLSGTKKTISVEEWTDAHDGADNTATNEEMAKFINAPVSSTGNQQGQCGRWVDEEESYVGHHSARRNLHELETDFETWLATGSVALLCLLAVMMLAVIQTFKSVKHSLCGSKQLMLV